MNPQSIIGNIRQSLASLLTGAGDAYNNFITPTNYSFQYEKKPPQPIRVPAVQAAEPTPMPTATPSAYPQSLPPEDVLRSGIAHAYGSDNPILADLALYLQASQKMPQGVDPMLPIILALRETQGGRDLSNPNKNKKLGKNNVYNLRGEGGAFQDYPDLATAILGNLDQGGQSGGLVGLIGGTKPSSRYIYENFRQHPQDLATLFEKWSPTSDRNGAMDEQIHNYNWIRNHILGIDQ
jgi:hypothetical protein